MGKTQMAAGGGSLSRAGITPENLVVGTTIKAGGKEVKGEYPFASSLLKSAEGTYANQIIDSVALPKNQTFTKTYDVASGKKYLLPIEHISNWTETTRVDIKVGSQVVQSLNMPSGTWKNFIVDVPESETTLSIFIAGHITFANVWAFPAEPFLIE